MKIKYLIAALATLTLAGCAGTPSTPDEAAAKPVAGQPAEAATAKDDPNGVLARTETTSDSEDRVICRTIMPTGSHRKKVVCRTVREIKQDRQSAQDALRTKQGPTVEGTGDL